MPGSTRKYPGSTQNSAGSYPNFTSSYYRHLGIDPFNTKAYPNPARAYKLTHDNKQLAQRISAADSRNGPGGVLAGALDNTYGFNFGPQSEVGREAEIGRKARYYKNEAGLAKDRKDPQNQAFGMSYLANNESINKYMANNMDAYSPYRYLQDYGLGVAIAQDGGVNADGSYGPHAMDYISNHEASANALMTEKLKEDDFRRTQQEDAYLTARENGFEGSAQEFLEAAHANDRGEYGTAIPRAWGSIKDRLGIGASNRLRYIDEGKTNAAIALARKYVKDAKRNLVAKETQDIVRQIANRNTNNNTSQEGTIPLSGASTNMYNPQHIDGDAPDSSETMSKSSSFRDMYRAGWRDAVSSAFMPYLEKRSQQGKSPSDYGPLVQNAGQNKQNYPLPRPVGRPIPKRVAYNDPAEQNLADKVKYDKLDTALARAGSMNTSGKIDATIDSIRSNAISGFLSMYPRLLQGAMQTYTWPLQVLEAVPYVNKTIKPINRNTIGAFNRYLDRLVADARGSSIQEDYRRNSDNTVSRFLRSQAPDFLGLGIGGSLMGPFGTAFGLLDSAIGGSSEQRGIENEMARNGNFYRDPTSTQSNISSAPTKDEYQMTMFPDGYDRLSGGNSYTVPESWVPRS